MKVAHSNNWHSSFSRLLITVMMTVVAVCSTHADEPLARSKYLKNATVTPEVARASALKAFPGAIVSEELEMEEGGSGLRYSFVVKAPAVKHEVGIDAKTGAVLENSVEGPHSD